MADTAMNVISICGSLRRKQKEIDRTAARQTCSWVVDCAPRPESLNRIRWLRNRFQIPSVSRSFVARRLVPS